MDYARALISARAGKAILFVGAGFSLGAETLEGEPIPTGRKLAKKLCNEASVPEIEDLKQASSRYLRKKTPEDLIARLKNIFTVKSVSDSHRAIAEVPWRSVYTTNYDNVLERAGAEKGKKYTPLTLVDDPRKHRQSSNAAVHINGYIDRLDLDDLNASFKLTNASYLTQQFRESVWSDVFIRDIQAAQAIFFVGYSLYDLDIQEILFADATLQQKVFFVQRKDMTEEEVEYSDLSDFGTILPIGVEQFVADLAAVDPLSISNDSSLVLTGFEEIQIDKIKPTNLGDDAVFAFLFRGEVNKDIVIDRVLSKSREDYVFEREVEVDLKAAMPISENFVLVGDLANGKTTLLRILSGYLLEKGVRVFWIKDEAYDALEEIEQIINLEEPVALVFENYSRKLKLVAHVNQKRKPNTLLLLSARSMDHESHEEDLYFSLARLNLKKTTEVNVNKLSESDLQRVAAYFERYGLWGEKAKLHPEAKIRYLKNDCNSELHAVLLGLLKSPQIQDRFSTLFAEIRSSTAYSRTIIAAFTLNMLNFSDPTVHMIAAMTNDSSIFNPMFKANTVTKQLFNTSHGVVTPKSAVLAEYALKNFPDVNLLVSCLVDICRNTRKKADASELYWDIYRDLASFRHVQRILPEAGKRDLLIAFYEGLRTIDVERRNPHFWLQYAIARLTFPDEKNLEQVRQYLDTALSLAATRPGYTTNDIETQYARYYLEHAINVVEASDADLAFKDFIAAHAKLSAITRKEKYKREPFRPARNYEPFYRKFASVLSNDQKLAIFEACQSILDNIKRLPPKTAEDKTVLASRESLENVERALAHFTKSPS